MDNKQKQTQSKKKKKSNQQMVNSRKILPSKWLVKNHMSKQKTLLLKNITPPQKKEQRNNIKHIPSSCSQRNIYRKPTICGLKPANFKRMFPLKAIHQIDFLTLQIQFLSFFSAKSDELDS
jgi:hypothetical protein